MDNKKKNIIYFVLIEVVTAIFFLIIGSLLPSIFGVAGKTETVIKYIPVESTITTTTTTMNASITTNPSKETAKTSSVKTTTQTASSNKIEKINLNTATVEELMTIKGIGEVYARRIIEFRDAIGGFTYLEQLMEVQGIGEGRFKAWSPYLTIED